jgi:ribonuclease HI
MALNGNDLLDDVGYLSAGNRSIHSENPIQVNRSKGKVSSEGDCCIKCNIPVVKKHPQKKNLTPNQSYYFEYYFLCPKCKTMYMVEEAKRYRQGENTRLFT